MSETPDTTKGTTRPAGEGLSDEEFAAEAESQTSGDLKAAKQFQAEAGGATSDKEAAKAPDEVGDDS